MNWKISSVSLLVATVVLAGDEFKSACGLYDAGKYADAAAAFAHITPKTAAVFYNLGNAQFRLEQLGRAVLAFERARQLAPTDPDILANLRFAEERLGVAEVNQPAKPLARFWESLIAARTIGQWARHEVAGLWLTVGLVAGAICGPCSGWDGVGVPGGGRAHRAGGDCVGPKNGCPVCATGGCDGAFPVGRGDEDPDSGRSRAMVARRTRGRPAGLDSSRGSGTGLARPHGCAVGRQTVAAGPGWTDDARGGTGDRGDSELQAAILTGLAPGKVSA